MLWVFHRGDLPVWRWHGHETVPQQGSKVRPTGAMFYETSSFHFRSNHVYGRVDGAGFRVVSSQSWFKSET